MENTIISKEKLVIVKEMLKLEAKELRELKIEVKDAQRKGCGGRLQNTLRSDKWAWRHKHIAYCELKGRTLEEIEGKSYGVDCEVNQSLVEKYKLGWSND